MGKIRIFSLIFAIFLAVTLISSGCGDIIPATEAKETRVFIDSAGREVEVPCNIEKIAVSGAIAQMYVFALCPDRLCGISNDWSESAKAFIDEKYYDIPALGQLYGFKGDLNKETIMSTGAEVIIDVGESKESISEDMDEIQEQINIPAVHIASYLDDGDNAFRMLGDLLGLQEEAEVLAQYCRSAYDRVNDIAEKVDKVDLLYLDGDLGQNVMAKGSFHSEVVDMLANNLADIENASSKGLGNETDMEQILRWDPDYIIFAPQSLYPYIDEEDEWQYMTAVKNDHYYEVPYGPYNWMGTPPGCQRYLGMLWMAKLLYPELADYDLYNESRDFYRLFIHAELTKEQFEQLTANSIVKSQQQ